LRFFWSEVLLYVGARRDRGVRLEDRRIEAGGAPIGRLWILCLLIGRRGRKRCGRR